MDGCPEHLAHARAIEQHDRRLEAHGASLDKMTETLAVVKEIERQNQERLDSDADRLSALESEPARRWENVSNHALTLLIGLVFGVLASYLGIKI